VAASTGTTRRSGDLLSEAAQQARIDAVGLRHQAFRVREGSHASGLHHANFDSRLQQFRDD
jgi:hypothetical protein